MSEIMDPQTTHSDLLANLSKRLPEINDLPARAAREDKRPCSEGIGTAQHLQRSAGQRDVVGSTLFGVGARLAPDATLQIELIPGGPQRFRLATARQQDECQRQVGRGIGLCVKCSEKAFDLCSGKKSLPVHFRIRLDVRGGIGDHPPPPLCMVETVPEGREQAVRANWSGS